MLEADAGPRPATAEQAADEAAVTTLLNCYLRETGTEATGTVHLPRLGLELTARSATARPPASTPTASRPAWPAPAARPSPLDHVSLAALLGKELALGQGGGSARLGEFVMVWRGLPTDRTLAAPRVTEFLTGIVALRYLADLAAEHLGVAERRFWSMARAAILGYQDRFPDLADRFKTFDLLAPRFDKICLNRNRLLTDGYADRPERPHAATFGTVRNALDEVAEP